MRLGLQLVAAVCLRCVCGLEVHTLEASAFDLTLANSKYAAVLFYDKSFAGSALMRNWEAAAGLLDALHDDATMVQVDGTDPELKELIDAYNIAVPSIRVFRRSVMGDYRGPSQGNSLTLPQEMADYIKDDAMVRGCCTGGQTHPHTYRIAVTPLASAPTSSL